MGTNQKIELREKFNLNQCPDDASTGHFNYIPVGWNGKEAKL
jgi:hypothetical protein